MLTCGPIGVFIDVKTKIITNYMMEWGQMMFWMVFTWWFRRGHDDVGRFSEDNMLLQNHSGAYEMLHGGMRFLVTLEACWYDR